MCLGEGGCGKSTLLVDLFRGCADSTLVTAYTHAGCETLKERGVKAQTFQSALWNPQLKRIDYRKLEGYTTVALDEFTMLPPAEMHALARGQAEFGFRVLAFGDPQQCPAPVEDWIDYARNPLFLRMCGNRVVRMKYKEGFARYEKDLHAALGVFLTTGRLVPGLRKGAVPECVRNLCFTDRKRQELNRECADRWIGQSKEPVVSVCGMRLCAGMPVMVYHETDKRKDLFKTQEWAASGIDVANRVVLLEREGRVVSLDWREFRRVFDYAFATTTHKFQGKTIHEDFVIHEVASMPKNVLYAALSRGTALSRVHLKDPNFDKVYFPQSRAESLLVKVKDLETRQKTGRIYRIVCEGGLTYIGQTTQELEERFQEHLRHPTNSRMRECLTSKARIELVHEFQFCRDEVRRDVEREFIERELSGRRAERAECPCAPD